ncbi:neural-cadherin-like [Macrosteles quadrilineatus]|uniref:neural-cadherin-like n=1 Tax=Macrosteles quadrilineatus TaxID=74068 RepID=UPI0023E12A7E|nr:neural-cadherin-like [Macrosteles quadrilineatus]
MPSKPVSKFLRNGVSDKDDSSPYFEQSLYEAEVDENEEIDTAVLAVTAATANNATNIRYEITGGNVAGVFSIDQDGVLRVAGPIDYETKKQYDLRIVASHNTSASFTSVAVKVRDSNDNPPVFERPAYKTQITEEDDRNLPKRVLKVVATDGDLDRPHNIVYSLTGQGIDPDNPSNSKFTIDKRSGEIFVLKPLDRDQPRGRPAWKFTVFAQDEGGEGLVGFADVQVNLKDINDNAPAFPSSICYGNITENGEAGAVVMTMTAIDHDDPMEGTNAKLRYSIEKNVIEEETGAPIFDIEADTGTIRTAVCCLDRERTPDYAVQVVASDGGGKKGTGTASIRVTDVNDRPPQFTKDEWVTEVLETNGTTLPSEPILTVTVLDEDEQNDFHYKVIENSGFGADKFSMVRNPDGTGSLLVTQPLDYEDTLHKNGFRFRIQVNDQGVKGEADKLHTAYSWVVVKLKDINDNYPQFERSHIEVTIDEDAEVGSPLEVFRAKDPDQGSNGKVVYNIDRATDRKRNFRISQDGTVYIQRTLDREEKTNFTLRILAADEGSPARTSTAAMTVLVSDVNDNAPVLAHQYRPVIMEGEPSSKVVELVAQDADDATRGNGPPFVFAIDPVADDVLKASFKVENIPRGAGGNGTGVVWSTRALDREERKEYLVPIVIRDSGRPQMTGTSTLTVIVGDVNDNPMFGGRKHIFVYNYMGQIPDTAIGRVHVEDLDDWDIPDKMFYWDSSEHVRFRLNEDTGMITIRQGTPDGRYILRFKVYDRRHTRTEVFCNVTVTVKELPHQAVLKSASLRITGLTDEQFIAEDHNVSQGGSKASRLREKLADHLRLEVRQVDIFSVQTVKGSPPMTDVRFSAHGARYYSPVRLQAVLLLNRVQIEETVGINITMVGVDRCLSETQCPDSCTNTLSVSHEPSLVNANRTALVGVQVTTVPRCTCGARDYTVPVSCKNKPCLNGGKCSQLKTTVSCSCPLGYTGPRCQQTTRSFRGDGWAWYPSLQSCHESHLSVEFITDHENGLILYDGPVTPPRPGQDVVSDFISLEIARGQPRLLVDFGSGTLELKVKTRASLADGRWHRLDVFWDKEFVRIMVDLCKTADITETENDTRIDIDDTSCQSNGTLPPFHEHLNVNYPLQVGGRHTLGVDPVTYHWHHAPLATGFHGCIKNLVFNTQMYDLAQPGYSKNSVGGCPQVEDSCVRQDPTLRCWDRGQCTGSLSGGDAKCECLPGYSGRVCTHSTTPTTFLPQSYVKFALSFDPDHFHTEIQLRFRSRESSGELFRVSDQHARVYAILELANNRLQFRYNLNKLTVEEKCLQLYWVEVTDGQWHVVTAVRWGSMAELRLDGGEGRRHNETFVLAGPQWLLVDKQEGVYAGGKAEHTGVRTFEVLADFHTGCIDDIRLNGFYLPLPPSVNGTQWGQATMARHLGRDCPSSNSCASATCQEPFSCVDLWNDYECSCGEGRSISTDGKSCVDRNECLESPCQNGGVCVNQEPRSRYRCVCLDGFWGDHCEMVQEPQTMKLGLGALVTILGCLLIILVIVLALVMYNRRRDEPVKKPRPEDDIRENIISYNDEGGGEDDMTAFNRSTMKMDIHCNEKQTITMVELPPLEAVKQFEAEHTLLAFDDFRTFTEEGSGSLASSLSSLATETEFKQRECNLSEQQALKFHRIAEIYLKRDKAS